MRRLTLCLALGFTIAASWTGNHRPLDSGIQGPRTRGARVTFESQGADRGAVHSQRARLLSLAVERGETPTPFLPVGAFRATYRATVALPARERMHFRIDGRGRATLRVGSEQVLAGALRPGRPLETTQPVRLKKGDNEIEIVFDSAAAGDGQFRLFWSGEAHGFEPIAPELLAHPTADPEVEAGEQLRLGHALFAERRCARCHQYQSLRIGESAFAHLDAPGPDLRQIGGRARRAWLADWVRDPRAIRPDASMPSFGLSGADADHVAAYLESLGSPLPIGPVDAAAVATGATRFRELGCVACHRAPGEGPAGDPVLDGRIALGFVAAKWQPAALVAYLQQPSRHHAGVRMPDLRVSREDASALAVWLTEGAPPEPPPGRGRAEEGRRIVQRLGCAACHELDVPFDLGRFRSLVALSGDRGCLGAEPLRRGAPDYGFDDAQRAALRSFLPFAATAPFRPAPLDFMAREVQLARCTACHALDGEPSTWARWAAALGSAAPLPHRQDPVAQGIPALTWVGAKLQPSWLERMLTGRQESPRPWLTARMPGFQRHGAAIAQGLLREHGYGPQDEPPLPPDAQLAIHGERLVGQVTGFGCVACHALGDRPAVQVFEREGIELLTARGRLRHEFYTRWLADPTRLDADARMPKYAGPNGKTAFTEVLGGDAARQFEAIWHFLGSRRGEPR